MKVVVQKWEESERGWGTRPDGYSIHPDEAARKRYVQAYWDTQPDGSAPDEYSRPCGTPYEAEIKGLRRIKVDGIRFWRGPYPGNGGTDGWVQR